MLQYVFNQERRFHTCVANRIAEIQGKSEVEQWHHVSTKENPADDASRGVAAGSLRLSRWQHGPSFLLEPPKAWPPSEITLALSHEDPEVKSQDAVACSSQVHPGSALVEKLIENYSHWTRLVRTVACFKSLAGRDKKSAPESRVGTPQLQRAEDSLVAHVQEQYLPRRAECLTRGQGSPLQQFVVQAWAFLGKWNYRSHWATHECATSQPDEGALHHPARAPDSRDDRQVHARKNSALGQRIRGGRASA